MQSKTKKIPWNDTKKLIKDQFPSVDTLDWERAFKSDPKFLGLILKQIIKSDVSDNTKPGPRPSLNLKEGTERLNQFMNDDFSLEEFTEAFKKLKKDASLRATCTKTGLDYNLVYRLLHGIVKPDVYTMTEIAKAYNKHPSYFLEYRVIYVSQAIAEKLMAWPESSISAYRNFKEI